MIEKDRLAENAAVVGAHLRSRLDGLAEKHPLVGEVRGMGLKQGVELVKDRQTKEPAPQAAAAVLESARDHGLIIGKGGLYGNVLRISPPLTVTTEDADQAADVLDKAFTEGGRGQPAASPRDVARPEDAFAGDSEGKTTPQKVVDMTAE